MTTKKSCLLIAPLSFYSYSDYIKTELNRLGYEVALANDEYPANTLGKIMGKLKIPVLSWITKKKISKDFISGKKYDLTIIIKGRGMSSSLISDIKEVCPEIIGYTFDSFKYHSSPKKWLKEVDSFFTFDYRDAENNNLEIIELFSSLPPLNEVKKDLYEISAIARNHSERLKFIDQVMSSVPDPKNFIYIYEQNFITFFQNFIKSPPRYFKYWKFIHFKPLSYKKYIEILQHSNFVVDFAHPDQSGITIRCFEAQSCGTKIITNNPYVFRNKNFTAKNTILITGKKIKNLFTNEYNELKGIAYNPYNRSISVFVRDLIEKGNIDSLIPKTNFKKACES